MSDLKKAYKLENLERAWLWIRTNPNPLYKSFFRDIYKAYSITESAKLNDLRKRLNNGMYSPTHAVKTFFPKKSGILRPYSLLCIEDQIVYQALINYIADMLLPRVKHRYYKTVFGNLYAGKRSYFFYRPWKDAYRRFSHALEDSYNRGFVYTASFDLTACYDSIDHAVLGHFIKEINIDKEFINALCDNLSYWTASDHIQPIYQEHGIPQGPISSGLLAECVLRYFDQNYKTVSKRVKYFRYVDDIRLLAKSEKELRKSLIELDLLSKNIGLFPQSSKIDIHRIKNINEEIKTISNPPEIVTIPKSPNQQSVRKRIKKLSPRYKVINETRFKYVLASATPNTEIAKRLLRILENQQHLYLSVSNYLRKFEKFSYGLSKNALKLLKDQDYYPSFTAALINVLNDRVHAKFKGQFTITCKNYLNHPNPELFSASISSLLDSGSISYQRTIYLLEKRNWWEKTRILKSLNQDWFGSPSYSAIVNKTLNEKIVDVAIVSAEITISKDVSLNRPIKANKNAQFMLKEAGIIGRTRSADCPVSEIFISILGRSLQGVKWKLILGEHYKHLRRKAIRWKGYINTDPTAWVNITDTINDVILDSLFKHDTGIGKYKLGSIGSCLNSKSRFAKKYPMLFDAANHVHNMRKKSDLSHPYDRSTGKITSAVKFKDIDPIKKLLIKGYSEMWRLW